MQMCISKVVAYILTCFERSSNKRSIQYRRFKEEHYQTFGAMSAEELRREVREKKQYEEP